VSIRDFFVTLFFVALGMQITVPSLHVLELSLAASVFVIVSRVVVVPILYALRLGLRTSIVPAINLAQVSEFSIVIASLGVALRPQISSGVLLIVLLTFAVTSVISTYMINFSHPIQRMLASAFKAVGLKDLDAAALAGQAAEETPHQPVIFLGFFRDTSSILYEFEHEGSAEESRAFIEKILVIDFNPTVMRELRRKNIKCVYGDIAHADTLRHAGVEHAQLVVSSITDDVLRGTSNLRLMNAVHPHPGGDALCGTRGVLWRASRDRSRPHAGMRSRMVQALDGLAMAGVAQQSNWRQEPFGRLAASSSYLLTTTYGDSESALAA